MKIKINSILMDLIKKKYLEMTFFIILIILILSLFPKNLEIFHSSKYLDKIFHFIAYFILALPILIIKPKLLTLYVIIFLFIGLLIEFLKLFNPTHQAELLDIISNFLGVLGALYFSKFIIK